MKERNICTVKGCLNEGRYCRLHLTGSYKEPKAIAKESDKRKPLNREYKAYVKELLKVRSMCEIKAPGCTGEAQGGHHKAGRIGELLIDPKFIIPACNHCNSYVEKNDAWARQNGFKLSKHSPHLKKIST